MQTAPRKVLLIDSEMLIPLAVSQAYRDVGPYFITATSVDEALRKMELFRFDLFLLALNLDDTASLRLLQIIDERFPQAPVILMTNQESEYCELIERIGATKKQGTWYLLEKPFNVDTLTVLVEKCLNKGNQTDGSRPFSSEEDYEKRNHLRDSQVQTIQLFIESLGAGDQQTTQVKATLTDISHGGLGLITRYLLKKSQPVKISNTQLGKTGVVAWTTTMDNHICRAGVQFC